MLKVSDIMTREVERLTAEATVREAMEMLSTHHLSGAPVVAGDKVIGVISMSDILGLLISAPPAGASDRGESGASDIELSADETDEDGDEYLTAMADDLWDEWPSQPETGLAEPSRDTDSLLDRCTVEEAMNREVFSVSPKTSVREAARAMKERGIHRLLVMRRDRLEGIVSALDIARAASDIGLAGETGVRIRRCPPQRASWQ